MRRFAPYVLMLAALCVAWPAGARTYNRPTIDGHVTTNPNDWEVDELAYEDPNDDCRYFPDDGDLVKFYVTWDADSLYVGLTTTNGPSSFGNGYVLWIDTDSQAGITGATDFLAADFYPRNITFSDFGADVVMGGWNLPVNFDAKHCTDPTSTTPVEGFRSYCNPGWKHVEAAFSWDGLFSLGEGVVPAGTTLRFMAAVVGGDGTGAYDALPTTASGIETDSGTPFDATIDLDRSVEIPVDTNADGVPDTGYPPGGSIAGTVTLDDEFDDTTVVTLTAYDGDVPVREGQTGPGGDAYTIRLVPAGTYDVVATAASYLDSTVVGVVVATDTSEVEGVDFTLTKVTGRIEGEVALAGGPAVDVTVTAYDAVTGEAGGDGPFVVPGGVGAFSIGTVTDGPYRVEAAGKGYVEAFADTAVAEGDTANVGLLTLDVVEATKYGFVDSLGNSIHAVRTTISLPADTIFYYVEAWVQPRDDGDRVAYWDTAAQDSVLLSATKLDPSYPTSGAVFFSDPSGQPLDGGLVTAGMFDDARAPFLVAGDAVEVLRVAATRATLEGVLEVAVDPAVPTRLALAASDTVITVGGDETVEITGQLLDASGNPAEIGGVGITMVATGVGGQFRPAIAQTEPDGLFMTEFFGTVAGDARVTALIDEGSGYASVVVDTLGVTLEPDEASFVAMSVDPYQIRPGESTTITAAVVDEWGNAVALEGQSIELTASPADVLVSLETPIVTGSDGSATSAVVAGSDYGFVEIRGETAGLDVMETYLQINASIIAIDESAPETDPDHNSNEGVDLTVLKCSNDGEAVTVTVTFSSFWDGVHLAVALDALGDAAGATTDPFEFPISYAHDLLPDFVFTYKYQAEDYADLRHWTGSGWEYWDLVAQDWTTDGDNPDKNAISLAGKTQSDVAFRFPFSVLESVAPGPFSPGDTLRVQVYLMQETEGQKRTALDSVPHDDTHDMEPDVGEWWETATTPVTLSNYAEYVIREEGLPPTLENGRAKPSFAAPGQNVTYSVKVTDAGGGIGDVFVNLFELGGGFLTRMEDDGFEPDSTAGDGVYTAADVVRSSASAGPQTVFVAAFDSLNLSVSSYWIDLEIDNPPDTLRAFADSLGDDHGPNQTDGDGDPIEGFYYTYPQNLVFREGSFDITDVQIFADGSWIVFRVTLDDLVNHQDAGAADWGAPQPNEQTCDDPYRTDLNLQKIDIYIDAREGEGSTSGFPDRYVDVANVDAWDYGISVEGWGKWFVVSNGSNSIANWSLYKTDNDIRMCDNYVEDFVDIRVDAGLFGGDLGDDYSAIENWDIIVCTSSHDGDSNDQNLGATRWVNANESEWQIGGGRDSEGGRDRDANIMDVAVSPGRDKMPGRPQEEMLDYDTPRARSRFESNQIACVLEATFAIDTSPPVIEPFPVDPELGHIPWVALDGAPAVIWTRITDVTGIGEARLRWYPVGQPALIDSVDMVNLGDDIWAADLARDDLIANANVVGLSKTGDARVIEGTLYARDSSDSLNEISTGLVTLGIPEPWAADQTLSVVDTLHAAESARLIFQDGTVLSFDGSDLPGSGDELDFTLTPVSGAAVDLANIRDGMEFVGIARTIDGRDEGGLPVALAGEASLTLHYPEYAVGSLDEQDFGLFGWNPDTERWILVGGAGDPRGNTVGGPMSSSGLYGVFYWDALDVGTTDGLAGVVAEPNPFSPNGDGLYDETTVTFYLGREADYVNIEFYDLTGRLARRLVFQEATEYTGRTPVSITWDGTDETGHVVPYGIYVMRVEAKFKTQPTFERVNRPVVVIK